jgi:hypothetical protein
MSLVNKKVWTKVLRNPLLLPLFMNRDVNALFMNRDGNALFAYKVASMNDGMSCKALKSQTPNAFIETLIARPYITS